MKELLKALVDLLKVKSLMTVTVMIVFVYMSVTGQLPSEITASTIATVITYYFTKENLTKGE